MATRYYGISRGETSVTKDSSTTSKSMELAVNDAVNITRNDLVTALERILKAVKEDQGFTGL